MRRTALLAVPAALALTAPLAARDALGMFEGWGAFGEPARCYAIAKADPSAYRREQEPYVTVAWRRGSRAGSFHTRLSRALRPGAKVSVRVGQTRVPLIGRGSDAWAVDAAGEAAIRAAMRTESRMRVYGTDRRGNNFFSDFTLAGAASAMDAATLACRR